MPRKKPTPIDTIHVASHPSRWAILTALKGPKSANELADATGISTHNVAWHGRELHKHGLISIKRDKEHASRLIYTRTAFLAEIVVDYEKAGTEATFVPKRR